MIEISNAAASYVKQARAANGVPDDFGLRVDRGDADAGSRLRLRFAPGPYEDDQVSEVDGLRLFVAADVVANQVGRTIDTEVSDDGTQLVLRRRAHPAP